MNKYLLLVLLFSQSILLKGQITSPIKKANFGVDADLRANFFNGFLDAGNDDWFNNGTAGSGTFVIDTTGASQIVARYISTPSSRTTPFWRGMKYPQFSVVNNMMLIDGIFIRDHHGDDSTVFAAGSNKNGMSPASWSCPNSQGIPDKNDILDMMMHVRRAGPNNTDSLWLFGGISIENTTGNRYFDFEMYQTDIYFDRPTLTFKGYGPDAGHTSWLFDASGNVTRTGDIIFTAEYGNSSLTLVEARIWVNQASLSLTPTAFTWGGLFDGATAGATYGYANILPKTAGTFYTGLQSSNNTWAGPFQLVRQDNSLVTDYSNRQFMEFSVNLSKLGLDPLVNMGDPCTMPFRRILVKSRASTSFSAELKDFVGPFSFFRAPMADAMADIPVFCGSVGVSNISVQNALPTSLYTWTTTNGNIVGSSVGPTITVNSPGTYIVAQELMDSCSTIYARDTVVITSNPGCVILSSEISSFTAKLQNKTPTLYWTVNNSSGALYYNIERSYDGQHFVQLGRINQEDNGSSISTFSYGDDSRSASAGVIFYRIQMVGKGGTLAISRVVAISLNNEGRKTITIMPNPVRSKAQLVITGLQHENVWITLYDLAGRVLKNINAGVINGTNSIELNNLDQWNNGAYIIKVKAGNNIMTEKLLLSK